MNKEFLCILLVMSASLTGCMKDSLFGDENEEEYYPNIKDRHKLNWDMSHSFSRVLDAGPHYALDVQEATFTVDTSDVWESGPLSLMYTFPTGYQVIHFKARKFLL